MNEELGVGRGLFTGKTESRNLELNQISILVQRINGSAAPPGYDIHEIRRAANG